MAGPDVETTHELASIAELVEAIRHGRLRIPAFSRPFSWTSQMMLDLLVSIERGLPIGSVVIWDTGQRVPSTSEVGGQKMPAPEPAGDVSYVVDGHQRLATLFGCLNHLADERRVAASDEWKWSVYRVLGESDGESGLYRHWREGGEVPYNYLPLRAVVRTIDFLAYQRAVSKVVPAEVLDGLLDEAHHVAGRIKAYRVPIVRLHGDHVAVVTDVFRRLNTSGMSLTSAERAAAASREPEPPDSADQP